MPFINNMTGTAQVDDSIVLAFEQAFAIEAGQNNVMDQFAQYNEEIGAKSIQLTRYARLTPKTTPLGETDDVARSQLSDSKVTFTPAEYGDVVTTTLLANLQTGGKVDLAAAQNVGIGAGVTTDVLALMALSATANEVDSDNVDGSSLGDIKGDLNKLYNKLARASIPMIGGSYIFVAHDDIIADIRNDTSVGSWTDVTKYALPGQTLMNEVGMYKGFRVVRDNNALVTNGVRQSYAFGSNALGKVTSGAMRVVITPAGDALGRFTNVGWHWVGQYGIVDPDAVWAYNAVPESV